MPSDDSIPRLASDITHQSMGPRADTVILSLASGWIYTCNETTADFLNAVDGRRTFGQIVDVLAATYDVSRPTLREDLANLADRLVTEKLLMIREPSEPRR